MREPPKSRSASGAPRHGEEGLRWVRVARLQFGHGVSLVDLSTGGARLVPTNTGMTVWDLDDDTHVWTLRTYDDAQHLDDVDHGPA